MFQPIENMAPLHPGGKQRLRFLDAMRGLAAVYVVVYHMLMIPQPSLLAPRWAEKVAMAGGSGVTLFFIVSAFSLYYTMPMRLHERRPAMSFFLHRFFRIAPLFYFVIVVSLVRDAWLFGVQHTPLEIAAAATFSFNLVPGMQESFVWAGWTIGVEMIFYAVFPLIYSRVKSVGEGVALFFGCLLLWLLVHLLLDYMVIADAAKQSILRWNTLKYFPIFAVGVVVYYAFMRFNGASESPDRDPDRGKGLGSALWWGGLFGYAALLQGWLPNIFGDHYYWQALIYGCLLMGLGLRPLRAVVNIATCYLGKISYSVYLNHPTIVFLLIPVYRWIYQQAPSLTLGFLGSLLITLAVVLPVSAVTYRFIERPGIVLGKRIAERLKARATSDAAQAFTERKAG